MDFDRLGMVKDEVEILMFLAEQRSEIFLILLVPYFKGCVTVYSIGKIENTNIQRFIHTHVTYMKSRWYWSTTSLEML